MQAQLYPADSRPLIAFRRIDDATSLRVVSMTCRYLSSHTFDVTTPRDFRFDSGGNLSAEEIEYNRTHWLFQSGELRIRADDGSNVVVNADTGDDQTLSIALGNANGETIAIEPWVDFEDALRWSPGAQLGSFTRDYSIGIINELFAYYSGHGYVDNLHSLPGYSDSEYVRFPDLRPTELGGYDFGEPIDGDNTLRGILSIKVEDIEFTYVAEELSKEAVDSSINMSGKAQYNPEGTNACTSCKFWISDNLLPVLSYASISGL